MKQTVFTIAIILVIVGLLAVVVMGSRGKKTNTPATQSPTGASSSVISSSSQVPIFFYGNTCPHCAEVEEWMKENKIEEKVELVKKEVYDNRANSLELTKAAKSCGLSTDSIGVPFLYTPEGECLIGSPDVISYLSDRAGLSDDAEATSSGKEGEL